MRWADLDLLGHVNNVVYVDYLQEARVDMLRVHAPGRPRRGPGRGRRGGPPRGAPTSRPLIFRFEPVQIECWVTEIRAASFTMAYEVFDETTPGERRSTCGPRPCSRRTSSRPSARAGSPPRSGPRSSGFLEPRRARPAARPAPTPSTAPGGTTRVHVRFSDVDVYGHVNNVKYFEYFQEARIPLIAALGSRAVEAGLAHRSWWRRPTSTTGARSCSGREPYDCWTWVTAGRHARR